MSVTGFSAFGGGRISGRTGRQLESAALRTDALGADALGAGDAGHRRHRHAGRGGGARRGVGGGVRVLGLRLADSGSEGRLSAGRHAVENAGGRDPRGGSALGVSDAADHRAARGESGDRRHRRARAAGAAGRTDGATGKGHRGRPDGVGIDRASARHSASR